MVPKILRALKATLLRRKPTTSPGCPTAPSFHAEPQYPRAADTLPHTPLGFSDTRNLLLASASDAMLATAHLAEIVALFPGDDDSCYEESAPLDYTLDSDSDSVSMFSSMTSEYSSDEFEGVVRCLNVYGTDINSDADSTFSHVTCEESFEEEGIFVNVYGADSGSDTTSTLSYAAAEESFEEGDVFANDFACEPPMYSAEDVVPVVESPPANVASAAPKRLLETLELKDDPEPGVPPPAELKVIEDIYAEPHYNMRHLTRDALFEAETRSRNVQRTAQTPNLDLVKIVPLKPHEHPEPQSRNKPSVLKGQGQSSLLKSSWNADNSEKEAYTEAFVEPSWEKQAEEILKKLKELNDFFSRGI